MIGEQVTRISKTKAMHYCKCVDEDHEHVKEVFSDGWIRLTCTYCGQVKYSRVREVA